MTQAQKLEQYVDTLGLRYFSGKELTWLWNRTRGGVMNSCPPENLWQNMVRPLLVVDEIRHRLREPVRITSFYRSPAYNEAVGGERMSYHKVAMAIDFTCRVGAGVAHAVAKEIRGTRVKNPTGGSFIWRGGIGKYPGFVHVDTRGVDANW